MQYSRHGGECCGVSIVHGFDYSTPSDLDRIVARHDTENLHGNPGNRLLEAVLTDRQLDPQDAGHTNRVHQTVRQAGGWAAILARHGFVLKTRFRNSNSGRLCNIFHRVATPEPIEGLRWQTNEEITVESTPEREEEDVRWSEDYLTRKTARLGLRVQYRHREGTGSVARLHNRTGIINRISERTYVSVNWDRGLDRISEFPMDRFVYELETPEENTVPEPEAPFVPVPVFENRVAFFAIRWNGTREGPFATEELARQRWSRVREYVRVEIFTIDGEVEQIRETVIAA